MDPVTLATLTSAVTFLATEAAKAGASEVGKTAWGGVQKLLKLSHPAGTPELATEVAEALAKKPELAPQVQAHLDAAKNTSSQSVGVQGDVHGNRDVQIAGRDVVNNKTFR